MMAAANSRNRILRHCGKIHSEIDEEPRGFIVEFTVNFHQPKRISSLPQ
jgi:hypothetical protein